MEEILVVEAEIVNRICGDGFTPLTNPTVMAAWIERYRFIPRYLAEENPDYKQLISYCVLKWQNQIFAYQRTSSGGEPRLHRQFSIGVGGHVQRRDMRRAGLSVLEILNAARDREIEEEFSCTFASPPRLIGWLNENKNPVSRVHLGVVFECEVVRPEIEPREEENFARFGFNPLSELIRRQKEFETWSQRVLEFYALEAAGGLPC